MMAEHLNEQTIELYRRRQAGSGDRQIIDAHLAVCEACLNRVLDSEHANLAFNSLTEALLPSVDEESFHLSPAELKSYSAGTAAHADRIICESHIEICAHCSEELRLLSAVQSAHTRKAEERSVRWFAPWRAFTPAFTPARVAVAIALFGLLVFGVVLWRQRTSVSPSDESARNGSPETAVTGPANETTPRPGNEIDASRELVLAGLKDNDREIRLEQGGKLTGLEAYDESVQRMARGVLAGEGLAKPDLLNDLSSPPITLLGEPANEDALNLISPLGKVISEQRPTLRWRELSGANSYSVSVFDANFNRIVQSPPLSKPVWTLATPLRRGHIYSWEVKAVKDGKEITAPVAPAPRAQFKVLEADKLSVLTKLKGQKPASHLVLGLTYARFGLVSNAESEFRQLVKENPDSATAKKLLRTVQGWKNESSQR